MNITSKEVEEDYQRFLKHEAMRANCSQEDIIRILCKGHFEVFLRHCKLKEKVSGK